MDAKEKEDIKKDIERTPEDTGEGSEPKAATLVDKANAAAQRMEEATKKKQEVLDREEELMARAALSGRAEAGQEPIKKEETDEEYTARFFKGEVNPLEDDGVK